MEDVPTTTISGRLRMLGHVVLFMFGCAFVLAITSGFRSQTAWDWSEVCVGFATSAIAFGLTALFVRWDGVSLDEVGAMPGEMSRFGCWSDFRSAYAL